MGRNTFFSFSIGLAGATAIIGTAMAVIPPSTLAASSFMTTAAVVVPTACSISGVTDTAHTATLLNGIYSGNNDYYPNGIGKTTITAFCNNAAGFAIYAVGYSGEPGTYGNNKMMGANTERFINTGTATSGDTSQWAMKVNKVTDATAYSPESLTITNGFDDYHTVPDEYTKVAGFSSTTDDSLGSKLTTTYAVYISPTQTADTYIGQVKYTLVHPEATPEPTLLTDYGINYLQDFSNLSASQLATIKDHMIIGKKSLLVDNRDGNSYYVAKLADGNIWLLDNLALDLNDRVVAEKLSSSNTNATDTSLNYLRNGGGTSSNKYPTVGLSYTNWTAGGSFGAPMINSAYKDSTNANDELSDEAKTWKYGMHYNYCAATAGSYCYGSDTSVSGNPSGNATEDICPKGWRMPTGGSGGEYKNLFSGGYGYNTVATFRTALRLPLSGSIHNGMTFNMNGINYSWTSSNFSNTDAYQLQVATGSVSPTGVSYRYYGNTVRCILDTTNVQTIESVLYMQDVTQELVDNTLSPTTTTLIDKRDGVSYNVAKLNDGNLWLLDNLALDLNNRTVVNGMNATNTNASDATLNYLKNGGGGGTGLEQYATSGLTYGSWVNGQRIAPMLYTELKNTANGNDTLSDDAKTWKYGIYYNFCAASAGSYCFSGNSNGNASEDICPKGWRMPTGTDSGEYATLTSSNYGYNPHALYRAALRLPLSGYVKDLPDGQGETGYFWSSTRNDNSWMHYLYIDAAGRSFAYSHYNTARGNGLSIRCIFGSGS